MAELSTDQRTVAYARKQLLELVHARMAPGVTFNKAAANLCARATAQPNTLFGKLALELGRGGKPVSKSTLYRWHQSLANQGIVGLVDNYKGSERASYGWEAAALRLYQLGSRPGMAAVAKKLQRDGHESALEHRVAGYLNSLSPDVLLKGRLGPEAFKNSQRGYVRRNAPPPGVVYQGDGHRMDIYLQHPTGNKVWRPELTLWIDVGSRYITGFWISEDEAANNTIFAIAHAIDAQSHMPAYIHVDNGSGYKNKVLSDSSLGVYERLGLSVMHANPYNAKAKGHVERWFGTMERQCNAFLEGYCNHQADPEAGQALMKAHRQGKWSPLTLQEWLVEFTTYLTAYHNTPHGGLNGRTPAEVWAEREHFAPEQGMSLALLPSKRCSIRRESLQLHNREYGHATLRHHNGEKLRVEWSVHNDAVVRVLRDDGRWICDAELIKKSDYLPASRIIEAKQKRLLAQTKRKQKFLDEDIRRAGLAETQQDRLDAVADVLGVDPAADPVDSLEHNPTETFDLLSERMAARDSQPAEPNYTLREDDQ